jgi:putative SOS response-associated peptidase YedK
MCGRVGFYDDVGWMNAVSSQFGQINDLVGRLMGSYNIAPTQPIAALLGDGRYTTTHFGLIPHWAKSRQKSVINARAETLAEKPSFREPLRRNRCLIPANGFYEWRREGTMKIPYWISPKAESFFAFAGLWDRWVDNSSGEVITSSAIITTGPNDLMRTIHDRMPVILEPSQWQQWLDPAITDPLALQPLLSSADSGSMQAHEVSTYVNSPRHDDERCIMPMRNTLF